MHVPQLRWAGLCLASVVTLACSSTPSSGSLPPAGSGQLLVNLVDAPNPQVDQIVVGITQVTAHSTSAGWVVIQSFATPLQLDLLKLKEASAQLGLANLPTGQITQVRLYLAQDGNYVVPQGKTSHEALKVPSGYQSGIKIHGPWEITQCNRTTVTLDFDGEHSIEYHQTGTDLWILRPVIRVKKAETAPIGCGENSGGTDGGTNGPGGRACGEGSPCLEGEVCSSSICRGGTGGSCSADSGCASGLCDANQSRCAPGGPRTACNVSEDCLSGTCSNTGNCAQSPPAGACRINADCTNGVCQEGSCADCASNGDCAGLDCGESACTCSEGACTQPTIPL